MIELKKKRLGALDKFGLCYLNRFSISNTHHRPFEISDDELSRKVKRISNKGILLSAITGIILMFPIMWLDVYYAQAPFLIHYGIVIAATIISTIIEFYILFLISLKAVHEVAELINMHASEKEYLDETVAAAFDGKLSKLETAHLSEAFKEDHHLYFPRLQHLTEALQQGRLNKALSLCRLDFTTG